MPGWRNGRRKRLKISRGFLVRVRVPPRAQIFMNKYYVTIGLEIHAELNTKSKMWCGCPNVPLEDTPNKNVCPICMAHPGTLPVANHEALKKMISIGLAVRNEQEKEDGTYKNISNFIEFDRKNYFYPDIPKAYQITQYKYPIINGGEIVANVNNVVNGEMVNKNIPISLTRIHMEEDTAKSTHDKGAYTLIDFNRAGVPLMELVTDAHTYDNVEDAAAASGEFARELRRILRTLDASDADMEKGQMRVEVNISVTLDKCIYGTKCEVKNINSFRSVEDAIRHEVDRHIDLLENGKQVVQETRGWDENKRETFSQRKKENADDYRYFPDPDLPKIYTYEVFDIPAILAWIQSPESGIELLPDERRTLFTEIGLQNKQITQLLDDVILGNYYLSAINSTEMNTHSNNEIKLDNKYKISLANYLLNDFVGIASKVSNNIYSLLPSKSQMIDIITMLDKSELSSSGVKDLLSFITNNHKECINKKAKEIAEENNFIQKNNKEDLISIVHKVIKENPTQWREVLTGNDKLLMYFVGQCMKESKGAGNPSLFIDILNSKK